MNYILEEVKKESSHPDNFCLYTALGLPLRVGRGMLPGQIRDSLIIFFLRLQDTKSREE